MIRQVDPTKPGLYVSRADLDKAEGIGAVPVYVDETLMGGHWYIIASDANARAHWHKNNPWADMVVYVPLIELAEAIAGGTIQTVDGVVQPYDTEFILKGWQKHAHADGYILPQPNGWHSVGVRYGPAPEEYLSPGYRDRAKIEALLAIYRNE